MKEMSLSDLIDSSEEDFNKFCEDKDLGYLNSFHNLMTQTFNEMQGVKDDLVTKMSNREVEMSEPNKEVLQGLYGKMMRVEARVFILRDMIKSRAIN